MLKSITISHVGPLAEVEFALDPRLNVITGDNGLGKSLLLDIAFWAECGLWPRLRATPNEAQRAKAAIAWTLVDADGDEVQRSAAYIATQERWRRRTEEGDKPRRRPVIVYAMVDGGFAVFDQARAGGVMHEDDEDFRVRRASRGNGYYVFTAEDVFNGLEGDEGYALNGIIRDWPDWQYRRRTRFVALRRTLQTLSKGIGEDVVPAKPRRVSSRDTREIPWIRLPYGEIPVTQASAAMRRIIALAYMMVWAWTEHVEACQLSHTPVTKEMLFLFDEVECHLHPKWQRIVLPALMSAITHLNRQVKQQIVAATHSPLVLASLEPVFDADKDQLLLIELTKARKVSVRREPFSRMGRADVWLTSDMFGLKQATSAPAEKAIQAAQRALSGAAKPSLATVQSARKQLRNVLSDTDPTLARLAAMESALARGRPRKARAVKRRDRTAR
jgi:hypothetical protein